jgi:serine/threonine-protein kinase RsbW
VGIRDATVSLASVEDLAGLRQVIADSAGAARLAPDRVERLVLAVDEIATNAVTHGRPPATVTVAVLGGTVRVEVHDQGAGFGHSALGDRTPTPAPDVLRGRGLWLASHLVDGIAMRTDDTGTTVTITVAIGPERAALHGRTDR